MRYHSEDYSEQVAKREAEGSPPKKVYLDLGNGAYPLFEKGEKEISPDEVYIGADSEQPFRAGYYPENLTFVEADGTALPFKDNSIDEIYIGNLFGLISKDQQKKLGIFSEVRRVLSEKGLGIIDESYTPRHAPFTLEQLPQLLNQYGLEVVDVITPEDHEKWEKEVRPYSELAARKYYAQTVNGTPYFVKFKKAEQK